MKKLITGRKLLVLGLLAAAWATSFNHGQCLASTLPQPAARFIYFFQEAGSGEAGGEEKVGLWERFLYSLILSGAPREQKPSVPSPSWERPS
jgi:hypothetical protein